MANYSEINDDLIAEREYQISKGANPITDDLGTLLEWAQDNSFDNVSAQALSIAREAIATLLAGEGRAK